MEASSKRLNKFISDSGYCSRREADRFIERGVVFINSKKAKIGDQVLPNDIVRVNGHALEPIEERPFILLAFNKPVGITSTTEAAVKGNIVDYVNHTERIFPIGRLDKDSQGLIFLTNNGDLVNKILRAGNQHEKEYIVTVDKPITDRFIEGMQQGVPILGVNTKKCKITQITPFVFNITLVQGLNRQIRRMSEYFGYQVTRLERIRIMNISLKGLPIGDWRQLEDAEIQEIMKLTEGSQKQLKTPKSPTSKPKSAPKKGHSWENIEAPRTQTSGTPARKKPVASSQPAKKKNTTHRAAKPGKPAARKHKR